LRSPATIDEDQGHDMADPPVSPSRKREPGVWMAAVIAGLFAVGALVNLSAQALYSLRGFPSAGKVLEFNRTSGRSASVVAQVMVATPGAAPFRWEVEDTFGLLDWREGGTVPLLCTHIHADHLSCVLDSPADRFLFPAVLLAFGGGVCAWSLGRLRG
jgi:hypothetical protein